MRHHSLHSTLAVIGSAAAALGWSGDSQACAVETYLTAVCPMALANYPAVQGFGNTYVPADGRLLQVGQYQALYALLGNTYGGSGTSTLAIPDLRGRVIVGAGTYTDQYGSFNYTIGAKGGARAVTLTVAQLPSHNHTLVGQAAVDMSNVKVNTTLGTMAAAVSLTGVTASTSLTGVTGSVSGSALTLKGYSGGAGSGSANGGALATPTSPAAKIYASATPDVNMAAGSISGTAPVSFAGNPTTTLAGNPTVTLSGTPASSLSGVATANLSGGATGATGGNVTVPVMPPYLVMTYFIAVSNALFPTSSD